MLPDHFFPNNKTIRLVAAALAAALEALGALGLSDGDDGGGDGVELKGTNKLANCCSLEYV